MNDLVVMVYDAGFKAKEARAALQREEKRFLSDIEDAVVVVKRPNGSMDIDHMTLPSAGEALGDTFLGNLMGLIFHKPEPGDAGEGALRQIHGALADVGVTDDFMRRLAETLLPEHSALFLLVRPESAEKVLNRLRETGGGELHVSLSHGDKSLLQVGR